MVSGCAGHVWQPGHAHSLSEDAGSRWGHQDCLWHGHRPCRCLLQSHRHLGQHPCEPPQPPSTSCKRHRLSTGDHMLVDITHNHQPGTHISFKPVAGTHGESTWRSTCVLSQHRHSFSCPERIQKTLILSTALMSSLPGTPLEALGHEVCQATPWALLGCTLPAACSANGAYDNCDEHFAEDRMTQRNTEIPEAVLKGQRGSKRKSPEADSFWL